VQRLVVVVLAGGWLSTLLLGCAATGSGLDGCFYLIDETATRWSSEQWRQEVAFMREAGFRHVIVSGPSYAILAGEDSAGIQAFDRFMTACRDTNIRAYPSLWAHPLWYARWDLKEEVDTNAKVVDKLAARYGKHPNFAGWYIPHETYVAWDDKAAYFRDLCRELSALCKQRTPGKKVILSPFFILDREGWLGDFRFAEPAEYEEFWYGVLRASRIDIVALQDSGEHLSCYTLDDRRPYFEAMKRACDRAGPTLWANVETGELHVNSYEDYAARFGRKTHVNDAKTQPFWRAVPADKLRQKLRFAHRFADTTITWGYREYWDPMRGEAARSVYDAYLGRTKRARQ
jgi:FAD/FMN-containing dehydrogenase